MSAIRNNPTTARVTLFLAGILLILVAIGLRGGSVYVEWPIIARGEDPLPAIAEPTPPPAADPVRQALAWIPDDGVTSIRYTNWAALKAHYAQPTLNSATTPLEARISFAARVARDGSAPSTFDGPYIGAMAATWGWDSTDLLWEMTAENGVLHESLHVLRLRDDLDSHGLANTLVDRGFTAEQRGSFTIYYVPLTETTDWHAGSPLAMHTVAVDHRQHLLLLSPALERVRQAIDAADSSTNLLSHADVAQAARTLENSAGGAIIAGSNWCHQFGTAGYDGPAAEQAQAQLSSNGAQVPFVAIGVGFLLVEGEQTDQLHIVYVDAATAADDAPVREALLRTGISPGRNVPYSAQFILDEVTVAGRSVIITLNPAPGLRDTPGWPQHLAGWLLDGDALFAGCAAEEMDVIRLDIR